MPISNPDVVDGIYLDASGSVVMCMFEERSWGEVASQFQDLERKINRYIGFALGGQLAEQTEFSDKPLIFDIYFQFVPPPPAARVLRALKQHLKTRAIGLRAYSGTEHYPMKIE